MYKIKFTDSTKGSFNIQDNGRNGPGEKESNTSLTLLGKGSEDYGDELWSNMVHLLENFCSDGEIGPLYPTEGQLWYNTKDHTLKVWKNQTSDIIEPAILPSPIVNYGWENLIDASYLKEKFGDGGISGVLKSLLDGFAKDPLSDEAKALIELLELFFLPIHGGTLNNTGVNGGKLYINPLDYTNIDTALTSYGSSESNRAVNAGFLISFIDGYVKKYLAGFGFDVSAFGVNIDSGDGSNTSSIEYLPLELFEEPTTVSGNKLKLSTNVEFSKNAKISTAPIDDFDIVNKSYVDGLLSGGTDSTLYLPLTLITDTTVSGKNLKFENNVEVPNISLTSSELTSVNKKYADSIFTPETLLSKIKDPNVTAHIQTLVPAGGTSPVDYNTLATALSTNTAFITAVANMIKTDTTLTTLNNAAIDDWHYKTHQFAHMNAGAIVSAEYLNK